MVCTAGEKVGQILALASLTFSTTNPAKFVHSIRCQMQTSEDDTTRFPLSPPHRLTFIHSTKIQINALLSFILINAPSSLTSLQWAPPPFSSPSIKSLIFGFLPPPLLLSDLPLCLITLFVFSAKIFLGNPCPLSLCCVCCECSSPPFPSASVSSMLMFARRRRKLVKC